MPGKVKVKIVAGRNLPVMDRSSDTTDAYVEVKLSNTTFKTDVCRKSLNPQWNSEWYRFEMDDAELQDEPLQIRLMDHDTYSANDAIGKVYLDLNPLLLPPIGSSVRSALSDPTNNLSKGSTMSGWFPVYDTMHGIRGEVNVIVKVELFSDFNKFRQSSCGVQFFNSSTIPHGYHAQIVHGMVEELVVSDDPEYQWIDKIRTPRASNEARQTLFFKLSGEVQRRIGLKVLDFGGNAVIGYLQCFDLEAECGIVVRGLGTAVSLVRLQEPSHPLPCQYPEESKDNRCLGSFQKPVLSVIPASPLHQSPSDPRHSKGFLAPGSPRARRSKSPQVKQPFGEYKPKRLGTYTRSFSDNILECDNVSLKVLFEQEDMRGEPVSSRKKIFERLSSFPKRKFKAFRANSGGALSRKGPYIRSKSENVASSLIRSIMDPSTFSLDRVPEEIAEHILHHTDSVVHPLRYDDGHLVPISSSSSDTSSSDIDLSDVSSVSTTTQEYSRLESDKEKKVKVLSLNNKSTSVDDSIISSKIEDELFEKSCDSDPCKVSKPNPFTSSVHVIISPDTEFVETQHTQFSTSVKFKDSPSPPKEAKGLVRQISFDRTFGDKGPEVCKRSNTPPLSEMDPYMKFSLEGKDNYIETFFGPISPVRLKVTQPSLDEDLKSRPVTNLSFPESVRHLTSIAAAHIPNPGFTTVHTVDFSDRNSSLNMLVDSDVQLELSPTHDSQVNELDKMTTVCEEGEVDQNKIQYLSCHSEELPKTNDTVFKTLHNPFEFPSEMSHNTINVINNASEYYESNNYRKKDTLSISRDIKNETNKLCDSSKTEITEKVELTCKGRKMSGENVHESVPIDRVMEYEKMSHDKDENRGRVEGLEILSEKVTLTHQLNSEKQYLSSEFRKCNETDLVRKEVKVKEPFDSLAALTLEEHTENLSDNAHSHKLELSTLSISVDEKDLLESKSETKETLLVKKNENDVAINDSNIENQTLTNTNDQMEDCNKFLYPFDENNSLKEKLEHTQTLLVEKNLSDLAIDESSVEGENRRDDENSNIQKVGCKKYHENKKHSLETSFKDINDLVVDDSRVENEKLIDDDSVNVQNSDCNASFTFGEKPSSEVNQEGIQTIVVEVISTLAVNDGSVQVEKPVDGGTTNGLCGANLPLPLLPLTKSLSASGLVEPCHSSVPPCRSLPEESVAVSVLPPVTMKTSQSPIKLNNMPAIHRRSSDSDLSITPKGNSLTSSGDRSSMAGGSGRVLQPISSKLAMKKEPIEAMEFPFLTMSKFPSGFVVNIAGTVTSRSVKLLERVTNQEEPESRDAWWTELRMEVRSHMRAMSCNAVIGYSEHTTICDDVCVLSASGTAAVVNVRPPINPPVSDTPEPPPAMPPPKHLTSMTTSLDRTEFERQGSFNHSTPLKPDSGGDKSRHHSDSMDQPEATSASASASCASEVCHLPFNPATVPLPMTAIKCGVCGKRKVPDLLLATTEPLEGLPVVGRSCLIHVFVTRPKQHARGEMNACVVSDSLPFIEYDIYKQLVNKLKVNGMNAVFGLKTQICLGERMIAAVTSGTAMFLEALPPPSTPTITPGESWSVDSKLTSVLKGLQETVKKNRDFYQVKTAGSGGQDTETSTAGGSDTEDSDDDLPDMDVHAGNKDACVFMVDDEQDIEVVSQLIDPHPPEGFFVTATEGLAGLDELEVVRNLQMFTQIWRSRIPGNQPTSSMHTHFHRLLQGIYYKLRRMTPCAVGNIKFRLALPEPDEMQISIVGMAVGLGEGIRNVKTVRRRTVGASSKPESVKKSDDGDMIFPLEEDQEATNAQSSKATRPKSPVRPNRQSTHLPPKERYGVDISPLSYIPGGRIDRYLGNLNFFFIRETSCIREGGGLSGFVHSFVAEVLAIMRAHVTALGGNAMVAFFLNECVILNNPHKNHGQCLINVGGDAVSVSYLD